MTMKKMIKVKELNLGEIKNVILQGNDAPIEERVSALIAITGMLESFKAISSKLKDGIENAKYDDIIADLASRGVIETWETPVFNIGDKYNVKLGQSNKSVFTIDSKKLDEISGIIPDKYKKVVTSFDKTAIEEAYDEGTLEPMLRGLVDKKTEEITKITKTSIKGAA